MLQKTEFSKNNTLALKGIAIIMMMFHHCFWSIETFQNHNVSFFPFSQEFIVEMSYAFKICVSIFVFITGYGLILSFQKLKMKCNLNNKDVYKWISSRLIKTFSGFWIIVLLSYITCQLIDKRAYFLFFENNETVYGIFQMVIDFFGLSSFFGTTTFNPHWWYMSLAILLILSIPVFDKILKRFSYASIFLIITIFPRIINWQCSDSYIAYLYPFILGIIFAKDNLMVKIANFKIHKNIYVSKTLKFVIETIIIIGLYIFTTNLPMHQFWEIKLGIIPVVLICYLYEFFIDMPILKNVLGFLGKYSMDIYLIHEFVRTTYLNNFIYSFRNFFKIGLALLIISLAISIVIELFKKLIRYDICINKFQEFINKKIDNIYKEKEKIKTLPEESIV